MIQVRFAGLGGQGIILMGEILGEAAVMEKKYVGQTASYGAEARGSACRSDVVISESWIDYPEVTEADILGCMSQGTYEQNKAKVNAAGGIIFIDTQMIKPDPSITLKQIPVPATERALKDLGNRMVANIIMLGVVAKRTGIISIEALRATLEERLSPKLREVNLKALESALSYEQERDAS